MKYIEKIKDMLCDELKEYSEQKSLSASDLEMIDKLAHAVKNLEKIEMCESDNGHSNHYPLYDEHDSSYARRGTHYVRGHYSRDYDDGEYDHKYSKDEAKDKMMSRLGEMMDGASPNEREILKNAMRKLENA